MSSAAAGDPRDWRKWVVYQQERFPLMAHGPLVAAFSFSAVTLSCVLRDFESIPTVPQYLGAFTGSLGFFMLLRIADELKDSADDARYRPYRAVPRGLVSLAELRGVAMGIMGIQLLVSLLLSPLLLSPLLLTWGYLWLMYREFFVPEWLKAHPFTYMWTHMLIMPLIDIYTSACEWLVAGDRVPQGLEWFLWASFFNGMVIEIGRKLRSPEQEEPGVDTYTHLWGSRRAVSAWMLAIGITFLTALGTAQAADALPMVALVLTFVLILAASNSVQFLRAPASGLAKRFELLAGVWTLCLYLSLGVLPLWNRNALP